MDVMTGHSVSIFSMPKKCSPGGRERTHELSNSARGKATIGVGALVAGSSSEHGAASGHANTVRAGEKKTAGTWPAVLSVSRAAQRLATYIVISKPKRRSVAFGVVQFI